MTWDDHPTGCHSIEKSKPKNLENCGSSTVREFHHQTDWVEPNIHYKVGTTWSHRWASGHRSCETKPIWCNWSIHLWEFTAVGVYKNVNHVWNNTNCTCEKEKTKRDDPGEWPNVILENGRWFPNVPSTLLDTPQLLNKPLESPSNVLDEAITLYTLWFFTIAMGNETLIDGNGLPMKNGHFPWQTVK